MFSKLEVYLLFNLYIGVISGPSVHSNMLIFDPCHPWGGKSHWFPLEGLSQEGLNRECRLENGTCDATRRLCCNL